MFVCNGANYRESLPPGHQANQTNVLSISPTRLQQCNFRVKKIMVRENKLDYHFCTIHPWEAYQIYLDQLLIQLRHAFDETVFHLSRNSNEALPEFSHSVHNNILVIHLFKDGLSDNVFNIFNAKMQQIHCNYCANLRMTGVPWRFMRMIFISRKQEFRKEIYTEVSAMLKTFIEMQQPKVITRNELENVTTGINSVSVRCDLCKEGIVTVKKLKLNQL